MGASESKTDSIDVDVDVADAPVNKTPTPISSTLSEADTSADDAKPATPQAVYRTADAPAADPLAVYGTADGAEEKKTPPAGKTPAQFPPAKPAVKPRRSLGRGLMKSASDLLGLSSSKRTPQKFGSLESVRGRTGANFEGDAELARDVPFCFCCASRQGVHVLVKGTHLFAFPPGSTKGAVPKFAIPLADLAAEVESDPHKVLVYKKLHGGAEYVLRFEDEDQVAPFCKAVKAGAELAALDRIKDNLGHPRPPRTDSTLYADKVGKEFASKQPEHEVTAADATELGALGVAPGVGPVYH